MIYTPDTERYNTIEYRRCGRSGIKLPAVSLGLWHNFGHVDAQENAKNILHLAFDRGITHFDLANNYGPPPGSAEENFGRILKRDFNGYRDEMIISTKAGYTMWNGPYGDWGSKKYLMASLDQSLKRMGLDYVDIFYHHRPDPETPLDETMMALDLMVKQGKALYVGISNYEADEAMEAIEILRHLGTPCLIHQPKYSMFDRWVEDGLLDVLEQEQVGCIAFSPLAQGLLTNKYLRGVPNDSRAAKEHGYLKSNEVTKEKLAIIRNLDQFAQRRGQSLAQMALAWVLKDPRITSVLIGVSKPEQLEDSLKCLQKPGFNDAELAQIESILQGNGIPEEKQVSQHPQRSPQRDNREPKPQAQADRLVVPQTEKDQPDKATEANVQAAPVKPQKKKQKRGKKKPADKARIDALPAEGAVSENNAQPPEQTEKAELSLPAPVQEANAEPATAPQVNNTEEASASESTSANPEAANPEAAKPAKPKKRYYKKKKV